MDDIVELKVKTAMKKSYWSNFISANRYIFHDKKPIKLVINLSECLFIEPFHLVSLACLIEEYHLNGVEIHFVNAENYELIEYLSNIRFFEYWSEGFDRTKYTNAKIRTTLCLWKISKSMISPYVQYAQKYFEENTIRDKNFSPLNISLSELFNNIYAHSNSIIDGFCLTQFYHSSKMVKIAISDFGIGIPKSVNNYLKKRSLPKLSDEKAIKKAFDLKFSAKTKPHNAGFGLDTIKTILNESNGILHVVSNKGVFKIKDKRETLYVSKGEFHGTHFELILDTKTFENQRDDIRQDFDLW